MGRKIDDWGESGRAEWYMCDADCWMGLKKCIVNLRQSLARLSRLSRPDVDASTCF